MTQKERDQVRFMNNLVAAIEKLNVSIQEMHETMKSFQRVQKQSGETGTYEFTVCPVCQEASWLCECNEKETT